MSSKLTLSIEGQVIEQAKEYARSQGRSLSSIVEEYLKSISKSKTIKRESRFHPLIEELCGSVKMVEGESYDEILGQALIEKYLKR